MNRKRFEIEAGLSGEARGGLTRTQDLPLQYEHVTTNAKGREKNPIENTWGALHEYCGYRLAELGMENDGVNGGRLRLTRLVSVDGGRWSVSRNEPGSHAWIGLHHSLCSRQSLPVFVQSVCTCVCDYRNCTQVS
jgi:hypothetical protein